MISPSLRQGRAAATHQSARNLIRLTIQSCLFTRGGDRKSLESGLCHRFCRTGQLRHKRNLYSARKPTFRGAGRKARHRLRCQRRHLCHDFQQLHQVQSRSIFRIGRVEDRLEPAQGHNLTEVVLFGFMPLALPWTDNGLSLKQSCFAKSV